MDLSSITVTDFKSLFRRDFPFIPTWDVATTYNRDDKIYYTNGLFYEAKSDGIIATLPTVALSWNKVPDKADNYVLDEDINNAFDSAESLLNQALFGSDAEIKIGFLYLAAHFLSEGLRRALQGMESVGAMPVNSRSVGSVSEAYTIPQAYLDDPVLAAYTTTGYGMKYLTLVLPAVRGNIGTVVGWTPP